MRRPGKLTAEQVRTIRICYARGWKNAYQLAAWCGTNQTTINAVVQGCVYKSAGGPITWPGQNLPSEWGGRIRGYCREELCGKPIADSGWAQRMHLCDFCFKVSGGKKSGRYRQGKTINRTCRVCGKPFQFYKSLHGHAYRVCSHDCAVALSARTRTKRPADCTPNRLYELYWGQGLTSKEIAEKLGGIVTRDAVRLWLMTDGTPRRANKRRRLTACLIEGCGGPIHEKRAWYGRGYGRFCRIHQRERDARRRHIYDGEIQEQRGEDLTRAVHLLLADLPSAVKTEAQQEIVLAVLARELGLPLTHDSVKPYIVRAFKDNADAWRFVSLAAPTRDGETQTWGERLGIS